ncbi:hypothetical protein B0J11DRAFT_333431 [Dendryphion nanum]|uniref:Uncharacterized protein n=1 Tax=Dendryphion nanum TaxID=256645 RepID=A0A9P9DN75_9PLEO|nr:hypothetical protein B0J11DRAFT_333431 [Dendryphion nanum]
MDAPKGTLLKAGEDPELSHQDRRRTIQTLTQLSSTTPLHREWSKAMAVSNNGRGSNSSNDEIQNRHKRDGPLSLGSKYGLPRQPSILITSADDATFQQSVTARLGHRSNTSSKNYERLHVDPAPNRRHSTGVQSPSQYMPNSRAKGGHYNDVTPSMPVGSRQEISDRPGAHRQRRYRETHGINVGSSNILPAMSPFPISQPASAHLKGYGNQQRLLQNGVTLKTNGAYGRDEQRLHHGHIDNHLGTSGLDAQLLKRASTNSHFQLNLYDNVRTRSSPVNGLDQIPPLFRSPTRSSYSTNVGVQYPFLMTPLEAIHQERRPRSVQPSSHHTTVRSSSVPSTATGTTSLSNGTTHSHRSRKSGGLVKQQQRLEGRIKRESVISVQEAKQSSAVVSHSQRESLTSDSLRLLREREKLVRWKAEREKIEFERREREKIRERVRLANQKEMQRSMELEQMQKEKREKNRGCCGIFRT